jgi:hypothetical protein
VVLAVLGNAVYASLVAYFGDRPSTFIALIISSIAIFGLVVWGFQAALRILDGHQARPELVAAAQRAEAHAGLVLLVSPNPTAADPAIIEWHLQQNRLRHCWLIMSPEATRRAADLEFRLSERNVRAYRLPIEDANVAQQTYDAVQDALRTARRLLGTTPAIVDVTGGTKPMTVGAMLACVNAGAPVEYLVPARHPDGSVDMSAPPVPMRVELAMATEEAQG